MKRNGSDNFDRGEDHRTGSSTSAPEPHRGPSCLRMRSVMTVRAIELLLVVMVTAGGVGGCVDDDADQYEMESDDPTTSEVDSAIIGGTQTYSVPAIGILWRGNASFCTATLVRPNVVITAAHCIDYGYPAGGLGYFEVRKSSTEVYRYKVVAAVSWGTTYGDKDISLLRLSVPVPSGVATPLTIATGVPPTGGTVKIYGYGCTNQVLKYYEYALYKRVYSRTWPYSGARVCKGDSGGPMVYGTSVVQVISTYLNSQNQLADGFGKVYAMGSSLNSSANSMAAVVDCRTLSQSSCTGPCSWFACANKCYAWGTVQSDVCNSSCSTGRCSTVAKVFAMRCAPSGTSQYCCPAGQRPVGNRCTALPDCPAGASCGSMPTGDGLDNECILSGQYSFCCIDGLVRVNNKCVVP